LNDPARSPGARARLAARAEYWSNLAAEADVKYIIETRQKRKCPRKAGMEVSDSGSLAQAKTLDQAFVRLRAAALQVIQQFAPATDHSQQPAPGMVVLGMFLEMAGQLVDTGGKQRYLDFRRTGVVGCPLILGDDFRLGFCG
jgi:hypothetical protein